MIVDHARCSHMWVVFYVAFHIGQVRSYAGEARSKQRTASRTSWSSYEPSPTHTILPVNLTDAGSNPYAWATSLMPTRRSLPSVPAGPVTFRKLFCTSSRSASCSTPAAGYSTPDLGQLSDMLNSYMCAVEGSNCACGHVITFIECVLICQGPCQMDPQCCEEEHDGLQDKICADEVRFAPS